MSGIALGLAIATAMAQLGSDSKMKMSHMGNDKMMALRKPRGRLTESQCRPSRRDDQHSQTITAQGSYGITLP
jgi:hypothetical protein